MAYNVRDYWVRGDSVTDDVGAIEDLARRVSSSGGGVLVFPAGVYNVSRPIYCYSNVEYVGEGAVIRNTSNHPFLPGYRAAFFPGGVWSRGLKTSNGGDSFPWWPALDVTRGDVTVIAGEGHGVSRGDFVAVRSEAHYLEGTGLMPEYLYFSKVLSVEGPALVLADAAPFDVPFPVVHLVCGTPDGAGPTEGTGMPQYMVENVTIRGFGVDAEIPFWGGGAYGLKIEDIRPHGRDHFTNFISLNALVRFEVANCWADFSYQFVELKLGSAHGVVRDSGGTYRPADTSGVPLNVGESAHNITITRNSLAIPGAFGGASKPILDFSHCQNVRVHGNTVDVAGACDNIVYVAGSSSGEGFAARNVFVDDNVLYSSGGANRFFLAGGPAHTHQPRNVSFRRNVLSGALRPNVDEWGWDLSREAAVQDNVAPAGKVLRRGV